MSINNRSRSISPSRDIDRSRSPPRTAILPGSRSPRGKSPIQIPRNNNFDLSPVSIPVKINNKNSSIQIPKNNNLAILPIPSRINNSNINSNISSNSNANPNKNVVSRSPPRTSSLFDIRYPVSSEVPKNNIVLRSPPRTSSSEVPKNNTHKSSNKIHELILKEWQIEWYGKAHNILLGNHFYIDTSPMRSGKTFIALKLAKDFDLELMVICPVTTKNYWKNMANKYGVKLFTDPVSYESLVRGTKNEVVQLYLNRKNNRLHTIFEVTDAYLNALKTRKILLILDEGQMIKNNCQQHKACNALIQTIITQGGHSRFGILSGTLIDKPEQIINLFRTIGYIRAHKLYNTVKNSKILNLDGAQELIDVCKQINSVGTKNFLMKTPIPIVSQDKKTKEEIDNFCFALYVEIIKPKVAGAMSAPTTAEGELYVRNGYFHISPDKANQLKEALKELTFSSGYKTKSSKSRSSDEDKEVKSSNSGNYIKSLVQIEKSKLLDMARVAKKILSAEPTNKVIITINYTGKETQNLDELLSYLTEYEPLVLTGQTHFNKRDSIIEDFNNNPDKRILIANPKPISVGISLVGDGQRYMLISPSAKLMEIVQLSARVYGDQLKSDSYVYIFYGITEGNLEANILQFMGTKKTKKIKTNKIDTDIKDILEKKSDVLGKMHEEEIRKNMKLPSDYEDEYEDEDEVIY